MEGAGCVGCAVEVLGAGVAWGVGLVWVWFGVGGGGGRLLCVGRVGRRLGLFWVSLVMEVEFGKRANCLKSTYTGILHLGQ